MKSGLYLIAFSIAVTCSPVHAQTACPQGVAAGSAACGPVGNGDGGGGQSRTRYVVRYEKLWGAFVLDARNGVLATASDFPDRAGAERYAMDRCLFLGGTQCDFEFSYNTCGAASEPIVRKEGDQVILVSDSTRFGAEHRALSDCTQLHDGAECKVVFSRCNQEVEVRS